MSQHAPRLRRPPLPVPVPKQPAKKRWSPVSRVTLRLSPKLAVAARTQAHCQLRRAGLTELATHPGLQPPPVSRQLSLGSQSELASRLVKKLRLVAAA